MSNIKKTIEAVLFASPEPLTVQQLISLLGDVEKDAILKELHELEESYTDSAVVLQQVASGWRFQVRPEFAADVAKLFDKKAPRYSKATLETLALIAYRQPITRSEIEDVRGVAVSSQIIRNMLDREWVKIVGRRDVPGKPALFGTTKKFLDYFNMHKLSDLPKLPDATDLEEQGAALQKQLDLLGLAGAKVELNPEAVDSPVDQTAQADSDLSLASEDDAELSGQSKAAADVVDSDNADISVDDANKQPAQQVSGCTAAVSEGTVE